MIATKHSAEGELLERIENGLRMVTVPLPQFAGLARAVKVAVDPRVPTMGVFASGRLVVNPDFAARLNENELIFVLAHELFHLALRTHDRAKASDPLRFNYAHDYIINDILKTELGFQQVPAGGLDWPGARHKSAEEILLEMEQDPSKGPPKGQGVWRIQIGRSGTPQPGNGPAGDVLGDKLELEWFPGESGDQEAKAKAIQEAAQRGLDLAGIMDALKNLGRGSDPGTGSQRVQALRGLYRIPWQAAVQRWLEAVAPGERTFVRPSRRANERTDVVLPGRKREGWILNIVLDTSGSMTDEIPRALGVIADICDVLAVDQVRLVQCDTAVTAETFLNPVELAEHDISGYGGSDLSPALLHLAEDPRVNAVVVLTDGDIDYPKEPMPYSLLWLVSGHGAGSFQPPYGKVIGMQPA